MSQDDHARLADPAPRVSAGGGSNQVRVRAYNERLVLSLVRQNPGCSKADIAREGARLGVDFSRTVSCYQADDQGRACAHCDACRLRAEGFAAAGLPDPTRYAPRA